MRNLIARKNYIFSMTIRSGIAGLVIGLIAGFFIGVFLNYQDAMQYKGLYGSISFQFLLTGSSALGLTQYTNTILTFTLIFGIIGFGIGYLMKKEVSIEVEKIKEIKPQVIKKSEPQKISINIKICFISGIILLLISLFISLTAMGSLALINLISFFSGIILLFYALIKK